jgi:hypothetical protein
MKRTLVGLGLVALLAVPIADALAGARRSDFDVSDGKIEEAAADRLTVNSKEMRATLKTTASQRATVKFTYLGPTGEVSHLGNGAENRRVCEVESRPAYS